MKKICFVLCFMLMIPILLVGCNKEETNLNMQEGFVVIDSVEYSAMTSSNNYSKNTVYSRFFIGAEVNNNVTEEDYNSALHKLENYEYKDVLNYSYSISADKSNLPIEERVNVGTTYYEKVYYYNSSTDNGYYFRSLTIKSFKVVYVQMKIISDSVIEIIDDDEHYVVQTVYYKAHFFN